MIINQEGLRYTYNGMTYTVGAAVMATEASEYRGLYGTITEIRDGSDRETENDTPDIYCCFEPPLFQEEIRELERRFTELYQSPKKLDEITLDMVIMAPEMVRVISADPRSVRPASFTCLPHTARRIWIPAASLSYTPTTMPDVLPYCKVSGRNNRMAA